MNPSFSTSMTELETMFKESKSIANICKKGGVENVGGERTRSGKESKVAMKISGFKLDKKDEKKVVRMSMGAPKCADRALVNMKEGQGRSGYTGLNDLNRVVFVFEDPLMLALMYECLKRKY